jgi:ubiquitin-conjugating enzyme E2 D/E
LVSLNEPGNTQLLADNGIRIFPGEHDIYKWIVEIRGPVGTPYEGGMFYLSFEAANDYPYEA